MQEFKAENEGIMKQTFNVTFSFLLQMQKIMNNKDHCIFSVSLCLWIKPQNNIKKVFNLNA